MPYLTEGPVPMKFLQVTIFALTVGLLASCTASDADQRTSPVLGPTCASKLWVFGRCVGASLKSDLVVAEARMTVER